MKKVILQGLSLLRVLVILGIFSSLFWINSLIPIPDSFTRNYVYIQIIVLLFVLGILWVIKGWQTHVNYVASILTIFGVLGTFIGIYKGLQGFNPDPKVMQTSIENILVGLKTAFITSIVGIISALIIKAVISPIGQNLQKGKDTNDEAINKLANRFADELKNRFESFKAPWEINLSSKLEDLVEVFKVESSETRKIFSNMQTDLTEGQNRTLTQLETLTATVSEKQNELLNGVIPLLTTIQDSQTNEEIGVLAKLEVLTTTVSEKQSELLNGVKDALTPIQTSLMDEQTGVLIKLEELTTTVSEKHDALLNGTMPALTAIQDSLTDTKTSVLTKLETLTATVSDEHDKLITEFETFSNNVAESITKLATNELISALSDVIEQFNAKITAQFGDNFKQLNDAVGKTVEWQQQYREQMNELTDEFLLALEGIEKSQNALENIANSSSAIVERSDSIASCAEKLEPILHTMNDQLEAFSTLRQKAEDSLPIINNNFEELTTKFSSKVQEAIAASETSMETQREAFSEQSEQLQSVVNGLDNFTGKIEGLTQNVSDTVENLTTSLDIQKRATDDLMRLFVSMHSTLQTTLEQELPESINAVARKLAALSEKFVEDYTPITEGLREVLMIAEGVRPRNPRN